MTRQVIALVTSVFTVIGMWRAGSGHWHGWAIGLANQITWLVFIIAFGAWGLLPLSAALIVTYSRNLIRWRAERHRGYPEPNPRDITILGGDPSL